MARACKCKICNKQLTTDVAYRRVVNGSNHYYCSEQEYIDWQVVKNKEKADRDAFNDMVTKIFGYKMINTSFYKEKQQWNSLVSDEILTKYMMENENYLTQAISRISGTEYAKIRYFSAIIKNSIKDFKPKETKETPKVTVEQTMYETPSHTLNKRRSLADLEDNI